ncbi:MAG TPA: hypothetical protein VJ552_03040 [Sediminibacterium sp.]|nr:hypothetical protein [Sediminibacterium sp.]
MFKEKKKQLLPLLVLMVLVNTVAVLFGNAMRQEHIDGRVIIAANTLLFIICASSLYMQIQSLSNTNPHVMVRGVMGSVVLKLFVLGTAAFIYLYAAGENKSVNALFISMGLYIVYTWLEVRIAMRLNPPKHGGN